jgi:RNA polymerase II subunit A small phosphatase-like protein
MLSTEDGILCLERFRTIEQPDEEEEEEIIGKAKECYSEGEKGEIKKKHHHHYIVDEDGTRIETLMADVEISLTDDERKQKAAFDDFVSKIDRETPKTEVIQRRHEKKQERRERKEKKKNVVQQLQASISPTVPTRSANKRFPVLLVLDLDGTLVHSEFQRRTYQQHDFSLFNEEIFVYKRPYLDYFISTILEWFDVAVWTASGCEYAAEIVRHVFPDPSKISFLFSSERCTNKYCPATGERIVIKDMKKVKRKGFDLRRVLIVDDTPSTWQRNYGNAVHIESYWGSRIDDHLLHLLTYLEYLGHESDVRKVDKRRWRNQVLGSVITHPASQTGLQANDSESDSDC